MRAKKAKAMRRADPSRPNPGRKHGGAAKVMKTAPVPMAAAKTKEKKSNG